MLSLASAVVSVALAASPASPAPPAAPEPTPPATAPSAAPAPAVPPPQQLRPEIAALVLERPVPTYSRGRRIASQTLLWTAAATTLIGAIGHSATSIPAITGNFNKNEPDEYWRNRLLASQILGATAQYLTAATLIAGAAMHRSRSPGMHRAGRALLIVSMAAHLISVITVPVLTPSDGAHAIPHGLSIGFTAGGLGLAW
jgi:hypothetical protein